MMLMPPDDESVCPICARDHEPDQPHDAQSLYYMYRFYSSRGRWPTWADAIAHCSAEVQEHWKSTLQDHGFWSEPEDGDPIADPPAESFRQAVGDPESMTFGPEAEDAL